MFKYLSGMLGLDVGIDLGSANIVVYVREKGIVLSEPSTVAVRKITRGAGVEVIAVGREAKSMSGKTPSGIDVIWPLQDGVIANFDMTEELIRYCLMKAGGGGAFVHPRVVISVPAEVTEVERKAVIDATLGAGASEAYIVEEPIAAALGIGLPIDKPNGYMVIDVGGGTSEVSVISLGGIVVTSSLRSAGKTMDNAIIAMIRSRYALLIGETTAEEVKNTIGSALPLSPEPDDLPVKGRDLSDGLPKSDLVSAVEVREALEPIIAGIEDMLKVALEKTPPELARDIVDRGIILTGGVALMHGFAERLSRTINTPVIPAEKPLFSVALGVGRILENLGAMRKVLLTVERGSR